MKVESIGARGAGGLCALLMALALGAGCTGQAAAPGKTGTASAAGGTQTASAAAPDGMQTASAAAGPENLIFFDSRSFDADLSSAMRSEKPEIVVNVPAGFSLNKIPPRVDRWLYSVKESGGQVVAIPEDQAGKRGIVSAVIDVIVSIFDKIDEMHTYGPSDQYRATLLYASDGTVKKVLFEHR